MTSEESEPHVARTVEARWIVPGVLPPSVIDWFARFPSFRASREDTYLLAAAGAGMSVKIRGGHTLDVKAPRGGESLLRATPSTCGETRPWEKWSFPLPALDGIGDAGWKRVRKDRRVTMIPPDGAPIPHQGPGGHGPGCAVELTAIEADGSPLWTLGFEAADEDGGGRSHLEAAAAAVFAKPLPSRVALGSEDAMSYAAWLRRGLDR